MNDKARLLVLAIMAGVNRAFAAACVMPLAVFLTACDIQVNKEGGVSLGITEGRARDEWTRRYRLEPGGRFELEAGNGGIQVVPATGSQVEVRAEREVLARSDQEAADRLRQLRMDELVSPALVRVGAPQGERGVFRDRIRIEYRVSLPPGLTAAVQTQNGNIRLENIEGNFRASSTNGIVEGRRVVGAVEASTVNGGITFEMAAVTGDVRLTTVNGGIRLEWPADTNATLVASTVNGGIRLDQGLRMADGRPPRQRVSGRLNQGGPAIRVETTNGGIRLGVQGGGAPVTIEETQSP